MAVAAPIAAAPVEERRPLEPRLRWWQEAIFVYACYHAYEWARAGVSGSATAARRHADQVVAVQRATGLLVERRVQALFLPHHLLVQGWDVYYGVIHFIMPVVAFVVLWRRAPARYVRMRRAIFVMTLLALLCFALWPLMPPRLMPPGHHDLVDTAATIGGMGPFDQGSMKDLSNLYAAMPSLHVGWSSWCALALFPVVRRRWVKALVLVDPVLTTIAVMVTGNHWLLDGVGGVALLAVGYAAAVAFERWRQRAAGPVTV